MRGKIINNIFLVVASLIVCVLYMPEKFETFDSNINFILPIIGFANIIYFWSTSIKIANSWVSYNTLFLLGFAIVHFQIPFLASIGIEPSNRDYVWINKNVVNYATWLSLLALLMWLLGYLIFSFRNLKYKSFVKLEQYKVDTKKIDILLVVLFIAFIGLVGSEFLTGAYDGGDNWGEGANYAFMLLRVVIILKLIYFFINNKHLYKRKIVYSILNDKLFVVVLFFFVFVFFVAGDRGPVLDVLIIVGLLYSVFFKKISLSTFILAIVIGSFVMSLLSLGRSREGVGEKGILQSGYENFTQHSEQAFFTEELATSNRILYRALDVVPDRHPYLYGATFASEIAGVVPFGGSTYMQLTGTPEMYKASSYFFTILGQGSYYSYGEGSEILADIYINFGFYGVLVLMFVLGYFISNITFKFFKTQKHLYTLCYVILVMGAIYINRSHFLDPLKVMFYAIVLDRIFTKKIYYN